MLALLADTFPTWYKLDIGTWFDQVVTHLGVRYSWFFDLVSHDLLWFLNGLERLVNGIPWWLLIVAVFAVGWRATGKMRNGLIYAAMLLLVGVLGLWDQMNQTVAIVIASVLFSLIIGLPFGILAANSRALSSALRPLLDAMQTMPTFVYLIPAVMFFGLGKVPAVIATTIYAAPPVVRLTSHAIEQVDPEVVEAGRAFGANRWQLLFKVQIPQALPTILQGINQTMMMAVSMIVTCSMIGARGLGLEVITAINRLEIGRGFTSGIAIVIVAVLIDRLTQGWFRHGLKPGEGRS
jgi:ABC-type proline/glycine betaine transport system permease subunit